MRIQWNAPQKSNNCGFLVTLVNSTELILSMTLKSVK